VELYNSEQEQVDALKAWWDKNGRSVIVAIVIVLLGVFGWKSWQQNQNAQAESASAALQKMMDAVASNPEAAMEAGRAIVGNYAGTIYSAMASMAMARISVEKGELDVAAAHLRAALNEAGQPEMKALARLRLSRVLLAQGKADDAMRELQLGEPGAYQAAYDEQRGDILLAQGKRSEARNAYTNALTGYSESPEKQELVKLKLDDLAESVNE